MKLPLHKHLFEVNTHRIFFEGGEVPAEGAGVFNLDGMISEWLVDPEFRMEKVAQELDEGNLNIQDLQQIVELLEADIQKGDFEAASLQEEIQKLIKSENKEGRNQEKVESHWSEFSAAVEAGDYEIAATYIPGLDKEIVGAQEKILKIAETAPDTLMGCLTYLDTKVLTKMAESADMTTLIIEDFNKGESHLFQLTNSLIRLQYNLRILDIAKVHFDKEALQTVVNKKVLAEIKREATQPWDLWSRNTEVAEIVSTAKEAGLELDLESINAIFLRAAKELISINNNDGPNSWFLSWSGIDDLKKAGIGEGIDALANKKIKKYLSSYSSSEDAIYLDELVDRLEKAGVVIDSDIKVLSTDPTLKKGREVQRNSLLASRTTRLLDQKKYSEVSYEIYRLNEAAKQKPEATALLLRFVEEAPVASIKNALTLLCYSPKDVVQKLAESHDVTSLLKETAEEALSKAKSTYAISELTNMVINFEEKGVHINKFILIAVVNEILMKNLTEAPDEILPYQVARDVKHLRLFKYPFDDKVIAFEVNSRILESFPSDDFEYAYNTFYTIKEAITRARSADIPLEMDQIEEHTNQMIRGYLAEYNGDTKQAKDLDNLIDAAKEAGIRLHPDVLELQLK